MEVKCAHCGRLYESDAVQRSADGPRCPHCGAPLFVGDDGISHGYPIENKANLSKQTEALPASQTPSDSLSDSLSGSLSDSISDESGLQSIEKSPLSAAFSSSGLLEIETSETAPKKEKAKKSQRSKQKKKNTAANGEIEFSKISLELEEFQEETSKISAKRSGLVHRLLDAFEDRRRPDDSLDRLLEESVDETGKLSDSIEDLEIPSSPVPPAQPVLLVEPCDALEQSLFDAIAFENEELRRAPLPEVDLSWEKAASHLPSEQTPIEQGVIFAAAPDWPLTPVAEVESPQTEPLPLMPENSELDESIHGHDIEIIQNFDAMTEQSSAESTSEISEMNAVPENEIFEAEFSEAETLATENADPAEFSAPIEPVELISDGFGSVVDEAIHGHPIETIDVFRGEESPESGLWGRLKRWVQGAPSTISNAAPEAAVADASERAPSESSRLSVGDSQNSIELPEETEPASSENAESPISLDADLPFGSTESQFVTEMQSPTVIEVVAPGELATTLVPVEITEEKPECEPIEASHGDRADSIENLGESSAISFENPVSDSESEAPTAFVESAANFVNSEKEAGTVESFGGHRIEIKKESLDFFAVRSARLPEKPSVWARFKNWLSSEPSSVEIPAASFATELKADSLPESEITDFIGEIPNSDQTITAQSNNLNSSETQEPSKIIGNFSKTAPVDETLNSTPAEIVGKSDEAKFGENADFDEDTFAEAELQPVFLAETECAEFIEKSPKESAWEAQEKEIWNIKTNAPQLDKNSELVDFIDENINSGFAENSREITNSALSGTGVVEAAELVAAESWISDEAEPELLEFIEESPGTAFEPEAENSEIEPVAEVIAEPIAAEQEFEPAEIIEKPGIWSRVKGLFARKSSQPEIPEQSATEEAAPEVAPEVAEVASEVAPEVAPEVAEVAIEVADVAAEDSDIAPEVAFEVASEVVPEVAAEVSEVASEAAPEVAAEITPEVALEVEPEVAFELPVENLEPVVVFPLRNEQESEISGPSFMALPGGCDIRTAAEESGSDVESSESDSPISEQAVAEVLPFEAPKAKRAPEQAPLLSRAEYMEILEQERRSHFRWVVAALVLGLILAMVIGGGVAVFVMSDRLMAPRTVRVAADFDPLMDGELRGERDTLDEELRRVLEQATPLDKAVQEPAQIAEERQELKNSAAPNEQLMARLGGRVELRIQRLEEALALTGFKVDELLDATLRRKSAQADYYGVGGPFVPAEPGYVNPIAGNITVMTSYGENGDEQYGGVDIPATIGTPVRAVADGIVIHVQDRAAWRSHPKWIERENGERVKSPSWRAGVYIEIEHADRRVSRYMNLDEIKDGLTVGSRVQVGQVIGAVGRTAVEFSDTHLHFEFREASDNARYGAALNPAAQVAHGAPPIMADAANRADRQPNDSDMSLLDQRMNRLQSLEDLVLRLPLRVPVDSLHSASDFGKRRDPMNFQMGVHNGIDLIDERSTPIYSAGPGKVTFADDGGQNGLMVEIDHGGGIITRYAHMNRISVRPGRMVEVHEKLGEMGDTGRANGVHLHYELRVDGAPVDPMRFINAGRAVAGL